jgi:hypothetical protein
MLIQVLSRRNKIDNKNQIHDSLNKNISPNLKNIFLFSLILGSISFETLLSKGEKKKINGKI